MQSIFVDTDVCLDLLSGRKPFAASAERLFSYADKGYLTIYVSSLTFANLDYLLKSAYKIRDSRQILAKFKTLVTTLPVDDKIVSLSLTSDFLDFEDAIQHYTAIENDIPILVTRNLKDYQHSMIQVMNTEMFLSGFVS